MKLYLKLGLRHGKMLNLLTTVHDIKISTLTLRLLKRMELYCVRVCGCKNNLFIYFKFSMAAIRLRTKCRVPPTRKEESRISANQEPLSDSSQEE